MTWKTLTGKTVVLGLSLFIYGFCKPTKPNWQATSDLAFIDSAKFMPAGRKEEAQIDSAVNDTFTYISGRFNPEKHPQFDAVPNMYASRNGMYLRMETLIAFIKMAEAAKKEGVLLKIISATRDFESQKRIWEDKWTGKTLVEDGKNLDRLDWPSEQKALKILEYSSMPGTSRHHWGTDMDLNALDNDYFNSGNGKKIYEWLLANASQYGFCQPYTVGRPHGYKEEKWHWTYMPVSGPLTEFCKNHLTITKVYGFLGAETAQKIEVISKYVLGINKDCQK